MRAPIYPLAPICVPGRTLKIFWPTMISSSLLISFGTQPITCAIQAVHDVLDLVLAIRSGGTALTWPMVQSWTFSVLILVRRLPDQPLQVVHVKRMLMEIADPGIRQAVRGIFARSPRP